MGARQSSATAKALRLVARGINMHQAAIRAGISYSTIFRACKSLKEKTQKISQKVLDTL